MDKTIKNLLRELNLDSKKFETLSPTGYFIVSGLFDEILEGVGFLRRHKLIHRDLKPPNILISKGITGKFAKTADFGLATIHDSGNETHSYGVGTRKYCAPEVLNGRNYDKKADIFSLGYYMAEELFNLDIHSSMFFRYQFSIY